MWSSEEGLNSATTQSSRIQILSGRQRIVPDPSGQCLSLSLPIVRAKTGMDNLTHAVTVQLVRARDIDITTTTILLRVPEASQSTREDGYQSLRATASAVTVHLRVSLGLKTPLVTAKRETREALVVNHIRVGKPGRIPITFITRRDLILAKTTTKRRRGRTERTKTVSTATIVKGMPKTGERLGAKELMAGQEPKVKNQGGDMSLSIAATLVVPTTTNNGSRLVHPNRVRRTCA
jgi:hypothetical protein